MTKLDERARQIGNSIIMADGKLHDAEADIRRSLQEFSVNELASAVNEHLNNEQSRYRVRYETVWSNRVKMWTVDTSKNNRVVDVITVDTQ